MKKIAVVTLYDDTNFGNKLQNFAVQTYFENMDFYVETLSYSNKSPRKITIKYITHGIAHKILKMLGTKYEKKRMSRVETHKKLFMKRKENIKSFSDEYINVVTNIDYANLPSDLKNQYDYFVTGSDQVWHCWHNNKKELEYFFLMFAAPKQRLTISPSFGFNEFPLKYINVYKNGLIGFEHLSCREESGKNLIKQLTGKNAEVLLDPTMLIDTKIWCKIMRRPQEFSDEDYILVYTLGGLHGKFNDQTQKLAFENNLKIININDENGKYYTTTRPDDFLYWIKNAGFIVTDSFHAVVFSILFNRPFAVFLRNDITGMEDRLDTLLNKFSLENRKISEDKIEIFFENKKELFDVNYSDAEKIIKKEREKALEFYRQCFNMYEH